MNVDIDKLFDTVEQIDPASVRETCVYIPTVEDLKSHEVDKRPEKWINLIAFFANDPYQDMKNDSQYRETVRFCKTLMYSFC